MSHVSSKMSHVESKISVMSLMFSCHVAKLYSRMLILINGHIAVSNLGVKGPRTAPGRLSHWLKVLHVAFPCSSN